MSILWIALIEVEPLPTGRYTDCQGGYVNGIILADSIKEAKKEFTGALAVLGWKIMKFEEIEKYFERIESFEIESSLQILAAKIKHPGEVQFGTFHLW